MFSLFPRRRSGPLPLIPDTPEAPLRFTPPNFSPRYAKRSKREQNTATCNACGSKAVHWRIFAGDYKLADDQRQHPGNRYVQHVCPTTADGFGDTDD